MKTATLEYWQEYERDIAIEVMGYLRYDAPYGNGYVCRAEDEKWVPCPSYMKDIYKALSAARKILEDSQGAIKSISLGLKPVESDKLDLGNDPWRYTFKFHFKNGAFLASEDYHACKAICDLCLFVKRHIISEEKWKSLAESMPESKKEVQVSREDLLSLFGGKR